MAALVKILSISDGDKAVLKEARISPDILPHVTRSRYYPEEVVSAKNMYDRYAEMRLRALKPVFKHGPMPAVVAGLILDSVHQLYAADPDVKREVYLVDWVMMGNETFPKVLGTPYEGSAIRVATDVPGRFGKQAMALAKPLLDIEYDLIGDDTDVETDLFDGMSAMKTPGDAVSRARRLGALRVLGALNHPEAAAMIAQGLAADSDDIREAAATAASLLRMPKRKALLKIAAADKAETVRFLGLVGQKTDTNMPNGLPVLAKKMLKHDRYRSQAQKLLVEAAIKADQGMLRAQTQRGAVFRGDAVRRLLALALATDDDLRSWLHDSDEAIISITLEYLKQHEDRVKAAVLPILRCLANDPFTPLASRARICLRTVTPKNGQDSFVHELAYGSPYLRMTLLDRLVAEKHPSALAVITAACSNRDAHTRAHAIVLLAGQAPERARAIVASALNDPYQWVRFNAASVAPLVADASMVSPLTKALAACKDAATTLYLKDALARAQGKPLPRPQPSAISIAGKKNLAWNTSPGRYAAESPFEAYYSMKNTVDDNMRKAHKAGKAIFARCAPVHCPALLVIDPVERDKFWLTLDTMLNEENLPYIDGVVYGEESMVFTTPDVWRLGWNLFCEEADIPLDRINGTIEALNLFERRAWNSWVLEKNIDGFNILYDYTKRKFGKLRPGLQVCSFSPAERSRTLGAPEAMKRWRFDMGGVYDYKGDNRMACYNLIRRYKTIWPDRPVLWLSLGIGGYEMNPIKHQKKVPRRPMLDRYNRSFSDSLTAWIAGADTGWFSTWLFVKPDFKKTSMSRLRGQQVWVEDIAWDSEILARAVHYSFYGLTEVKEEVKIPTAPTGGGDLLGEWDDGGLELDDPELAREAKRLKQQTALDSKNREAMDGLRNGLLFYQQYVYDCARIFSSLPRRHPKPKALAVRPGINVWTWAEHKLCPLVPGQAILNEYDFLCDINVAPLVGLDRYKYIVVHDPGVTVLL